MGLAILRQCWDDAMYPNELQGIANVASPSGWIRNAKAIALRNPNVPDSVF